MIALVHGARVGFGLLILLTLIAAVCAAVAPYLEQRKKDRMNESDENATVLVEAPR